MSNTKLSPDDYEKLKGFMGLYVDWFFPKVGKPENHPLIFIADLEKESLANAKRGLQMAINDIVESSPGWRPEQVAEADEKFAAHGVFTLSQVRCSYSKKYLQILKRGAIRTQPEYYLLKGILDGGGEVNAVEKQQVEELLIAFETKVLESARKKQKMLKQCQKPCKAKK